MPTETPSGGAARPPSEAAESLAFIRRVMTRTQQQADASGHGVLLWWAGLTALGVGAMAALGICTGRVTGAQSLLIWGGHNLLGWAGTLWAVRRSGTLTPLDRQELAAWAFATLAVWALGLGGAASGAIEGWAFFPILQLVLGLAVVFSAILERGRALGAVGVVLIVSAPVILAAVPARWVWLVSGGLFATALLVAAVVMSIAWRKRRAAQAH